MGWFIAGVFAVILVFGYFGLPTRHGMTVGELVRTIDANRNHANLSSAIRLFVLGVYRDQRRLKRAAAAGSSKGQPPL